MVKGGPMAQKRFRREQSLHLLLRHRTLPEIRNPPPSTLHPPRYQAEKGVLELLKYGLEPEWESIKKLE